MLESDDPVSVMAATENMVIHRFTIDDLLPMVDAGVLDPKARVGKRSQLQPDIALLKLRHELPDPARWPDADSIHVVVEVAVSSLAFDRGAKRRLHARGGIEEYWVVDLHRRTVEVSRAPVDDLYRITQTYRPGERIATVFDRVIEVSAFLPEPNA